MSNSPLESEPQPDTSEFPERRLRARIRGTFKVNVVDGVEEVLVQSIDLGASGMCFGTNRQMSLFREISLSFKLPGQSNEPEATFHCHAVVVSCDRRAHNDGYFVALSFLEVSDDDREIFNRFLGLAREQSS